MAKLSTETKALDTKLYTKVKTSLSNSSVLASYKKMMGKFINDRNVVLYDTFPANRIMYTATDVQDFFNAIKIDINEVTSIVKETYYSKITDFNPRAAKDEVTVTAMCIIKYFYSKKMTKELDLAMIYLCFSGKFYPSIHYSSYPTALPADYRYVCDYVINTKLSNKFDLKVHGSVIGAVKSIATTWLNSYKDRLSGTSTDEDYVYMIQQIHTRIKSFMQNIAEVYYKCYENREYMTYESDDNSQDSFRIAESDSTRIETLSNSAVNYMCTHAVDYRLCKSCSDENIKTDEVHSIMTSLIKNPDNLPYIQELTSLMIATYFEENKTKDVRDNSFILYSIEAKPNSKNKNVLRVQAIVEKILTENSVLYTKRKSRIPTRNSYNKAVLAYFALVINQAAK